MSARHRYCKYAQSMSAMTATAPLLDRNERRFPLAMDPRSRRSASCTSPRRATSGIRSATSTGTRSTRTQFDDEQREAARNWWSRRGWGEYGAISESPTLSVRFTQDRLPVEMALFFALRTQEEARHAETCYRMAERLGGYIPAPVHADLTKAIGSHGVRKMALDPQTSVEQIIAALVCGLEEYAFDWFKLMIDKATHPVANRALRLILRDEVRHCAFGWHFIEHASAAHGARRDRAHAPGVHRYHDQRRARRLPRAVARARVADDRGGRPHRPPHLRGGPRRPARGGGEAGVHRVRQARARALRRPRHRHPDVHAPQARHVLSARILQEYRFPLHLEPSVESIWDLYNRAKRERWDPSRSIDWARFDPAQLEPRAREAARLAWSHRAWLLFGRLSETPSLLVRFCLERQRESDPKYFLALRGSEEAWHLDASHGFAERLGGFIAQPRDAAYAESFNQTLHREVLDADFGLDAYIGAYVALRESLDVALLEAARVATTEPVMAQALDLMLRDKRRHAQFGWLYLSQRKMNLDARAMALRAQEMLERFYASGLMVPGYSPERAGDVAEAIEIAAGAGLGMAAFAAQKRALAAALDDARSRLGALSVDCAGLKLLP